MAGTAQRPSSCLIRRVLGDHGHLSNHQAAALLMEVLGRSAAGRLRHVVQLHLSRHCNRPELARKAAGKILRDHKDATQWHTATQDCAGSWLTMSPSPAAIKARARKPISLAAKQPWLPGWEG